MGSNKTPGRIGLTIGLIFGLAGLLLPVDVMRHKGILSLPVAVTVMVAVSGVAIGIYLYFLSDPDLFSLDPALSRTTTNEDVLKNGYPGVAKVLKKTDTGKTIKTQTQVELLLEITMEDCAPFQSTIKALVPRLQPGLYDPGTVVEVRSDPKNPKMFSIVGMK